jgi:hypothetical protein
MPDLALGLTLGEGDADTVIGPIGPPLTPPAVTGAFKLENDVEFFLTEGGDYLAFD